MDNVILKIYKKTFATILLKVFEKRLIIFPKQAIGTISSSTRILSKKKKKMMNALLVLNYLFSYI